MADETDTEQSGVTPPPSGPTPEQAARVAKMAPMVELVQSAAFNEVLTTLREIHEPFRDELGYAHVFGVMDMMPRLKVWAESQ